MTTITEDYVSFEIAKLLKEKGFDVPCNGYYNQEKVLERISLCSVKDTLSSPFYFDCIPAPTLQMAMRWLRETYYLHITVHPGVSEYGLVWTYVIVFVKESGKEETYFYKINQVTTPIVESKSYEEACEEAIRYCLVNLI